MQTLFGKIKKHASHVVKHVKKHKHHYALATFGSYAIIKAIVLLAGFLGSFSLIQHHASADGFDCSTVTDIPQVECEALVALYTNTDGPSWTTTTNRLGNDDSSPESVCDRFGIVCSDGHVSEINLGYYNPMHEDPIYGNNLSGALPAEIGNFSQLESIRMDYNTITSLPEEIGNLTGLTVLLLAHNYLTTLPATFTGLSNLPEVPGRIGDFSLEYNHIETCALSEELLDFVNQKSSGSPEWQASQTNSCPFNCSNVSMVSQAECEALVDMFDATNGLNWNNTGNRFTTYNIYDWYGVALDVYTCCVPLEETDCPVDPATANCSRLGGMRDRSCTRDYTSLTCTGVNGGGIDTIDLGNNNLSGFIPESFGDLFQLRSLDFQGNSLISLPDSIIGLTNLTELNMNANSLTSLPDSITGLTNLTTISVENNYLSPCTMNPDTKNFIDTLYGNSQRQSNQTNTCPVCGNGTIETGEACDDELNNGYQGYCNTSCDGQTPPFSCSNVTDVPESECEALLAIYDSTQGTGWSNQGYRYGNQDTTPETVCDRGGISCDVNHIIGIYLAGNNLTGDLSSDIEYLPYLQLLNLESNTIRSLPTSIGNLTNLQEINLRHNNLTSLPSSIGDLTNLIYLYVQDNQLTSLPTSIGNLSNLIRLYIYENDLDSLPTTIGDLSQLTQLYADNNHLTDIPTEIGNLSNLEELYISNNQLTSLPDNLTGLSNLGALGADNNQMTVLPSGFGNLTNLGTLYLNNNKLGSLSDNFTGLVGLTPGSLFLENNCLDTGSLDEEVVIFADTNVGSSSRQNQQYACMAFDCSIVTDISQTECEAVVYLYDNTLGTGWTTQTYRRGTGDYSPNTICDRYGISCSSQEMYDCYDGMIDCPANPENNVNCVPQGQLIPGCDDPENPCSYITCSVPGSIKIQQLGLGSNNIVGDIPADISDLSGLTTLDFSNNAITSLPTEIASLANLMELYVNHNQLTSLPTALENMTSLQSLQAGENLIQTIDDVVFPITLQGLYLNDNLISDIPETIGDISSLSSLNFSSNGLTSLPTEIGNLTNLAGLYVKNNQISSLPESFSNLSNLSSLDIGANQFTEFPQQISGLSVLSYIDISDNQLTSLPAWLATMASLQFLSANNNHITTLADEIRNSTNIYSLYLSGNELNTIPETILNMSNLSDGSLRLDNNNICTGGFSLELMNFLDLKASLGGVSWRTTQDTSACNGRSSDICGNGEKETDEACDDGNLVDGDGCSSECVQEETNTDEPGGGGGNGGGALNKDQCPEQRDCSSSYYDTLCGPCPTTGTGTAHNAASGEVSNSPYSAELTQAYQRAFTNGITTMPTIQDANLDAKVIRMHFAKMITEYAIKILGKKPNTKLSCNFSDTSKETPEMKFYIKTACQLGLMGRESDGLSTKRAFDPSGTMTRAQFGTVLSRLLYGTKYNSSDSVLRYTKHLNALNKAGIINDISKPSTDELRGYLMLMLMRSTDTNTPHGSASAASQGASLLF